jgi:uncharacterized protein
MTMRGLEDFYGDAVDGARGAAFRSLWTIARAAGVALVVAGALIAARAGSSPAAAQDAGAAPPVKRPAEPSRFVVPDRNHLNRGTVTLVTAPVGGALAAMGSDMARVLDSDDLRVLPILGKGSVQNILDVLYLKNVDLAFAYSDALEFVRTQYNIGDVGKRVVYITKIYNSDIHIIAPVAIKSVRDLAGKKIMSEKNLGYFAARTIFDRLKIDAVFDYDTDDALGLYKLSQGEADAWIVSAGRIAPIVRNFANEGGKFHLVPIPYEDSLLDVYAPSSFSNADYSNLVQPGETVPTLSSSLLLMAYNWPEGSERYSRVQRFVNAFFSRIGDFQNPSRHPKWKEVSLTAEVPGWQRFKPAQEWLAQHVAPPVGQVSMAEDFQQFLTQRGGSRRNFSQAEVQKLIVEFAAWRQKEGH